MGKAACAAVGSTTFLSTLLNLSMVNSLSASTAKMNNDYKALVCIQLLGGNDSFNMLVPDDEINYNTYSNSRSTLALPREDLLSLNGVDFGLHPAMAGVQDLYNNDNLAFLCNVGTLVEPLVDNDAYNNPSIPKPLALRSHSDQRHQWQTSVPQDRDALGWGGRLAEIMTNLNTTQNVSMNISLGGHNVFQTGGNISSYSASRNGVEQIYESWGLNPANSGFLDLLRENGTNDLVTTSYQNIFQQSFASQMNNAIFASDFLGDAIENIEFTTTFSDTFVSRDLHMVAKMIAAQAETGMNRQTFFVNVGNWDMHFDLLSRHNSKLTDLNNALTEFNSALAEINRQNEVTTFTISDFGRTLTANNNGSDHAWGGHQMIMGGAVNGGQLYGNYPDLSLTNNPLVIDSRGRFIPQVSTDEYFAELALWFGLSAGELEDVLPNISRFYSTMSGTPPLGFMNMG